MDGYEDDDYYQDDGEMNCDNHLNDTVQNGRIPHYEPIHGKPTSRPQHVRHYGFSQSPYAWRPSKIPDASPSVEEDEIFQSDVQVPYFDPFEAAGEEAVEDKQDVENSEFEFNPFLDNPGQARKVCGQISKLLRDKNSPSRGSRMFQKRRKRADKFAIIGYGTQPTEEDYSRHSESEEDSEDSESEELTRIDYGTSDEEIDAYDKPGINNALTVTDHLNPSDQIIQRQLKNLAMDASGMRGKGAKIFAKRQQRMENYIITDENRKTVRRPSDQGDFIVDQPQEPVRASYVRPGSSISIDSKPKYGRAKPPIVNRGTSGYSTDVEDDRRRSFKPQVNYFSDCEGPAPARSGRPRRTRPVNRRAWESEDEADSARYPQSEDEAIATHKPLNNYTLSPDVSPVRNQPPQPDPQSPMQQFRRVLPPGHSPFIRTPPAYQPPDPSPERRTSYEQKPPHPEPRAEPRRVWSRVTFQPRRKTVIPDTPKSVIDYPCEKTPAAKPPALGGYRTPSHSPQKPPPNLQQSPKPAAKQPAYTPPKIRAPVPQTVKKPAAYSPPAQPLLPKASSAQYDVKAAPGTHQDKSPKPPSAISLLEKPIKHEPKSKETHPPPFTPHVVQKVAFTGPTDEDFVGVVETDDAAATTISQSDFVEPPEATSPSVSGAIQQVEVKGPSDEDFVSVAESDNTATPVVSQSDFIETSEDTTLLPEEKASEFSEEHTSPTADNLADNEPEVADSGISTNALGGTEKAPDNKIPDSPPGSPVSVASYVSSNSSTFTSMLPARCLSPSTRPYTPNGGSSSPRAIKIVSKSRALKPLTPTQATPSQDGAKEQKIATNPQPVPSQDASKQFPAPSENIMKGDVYPVARTQPVAKTVPPPPQPPQLRPQQTNTEPDKSDKISACLKVLDPTKTLFKPQPKVQYQPTPTLNAILQSENESESYGSFNTPPISYCPPIDIKPAVKSPPQRVKSSYQPPRARTSSVGQAPQPLGMIAGAGIKGKGAKMFEKQQQRMQRYTKETSAEDFPDLQKDRSDVVDSRVSNGKFYAPAGSRRMAGFSPDGKKIEPGSEVRSSMMQVMGEFQKGSKPGKVKRPSETKKKGRDPLYYQQYLFYQPPSDADFVEAPQDMSGPSSDVSSEFSSRVVESDFVTSPNASMTSLTTQNSDGSALSGGPMTNSSSSMTSQRSSGPKTAPKPSKALISRQLSKPTSPVPVVSISPTPEVQGFKPTQTSPTPPGVENDYSFNGVSEDKNTTCIEDMITQERQADEHRDMFVGRDARERVVSHDIDEQPTLTDPTTVHGSDMARTRDECSNQNGIFPPSYDEVTSSEAKPRHCNSNGAALPRDVATANSCSVAAKSPGFHVPKPKFAPKKNGIEVKMWKPGQ